MAVAKQFQASQVGGQVNLTPRLRLGEGKATCSAALEKVAMQRKMLGLPGGVCHGWRGSVAVVHLLSQLEHCFSTLTACEHHLGGFRTY